MNVAEFVGQQWFGDLVVLFVEEGETLNGFVVNIGLGKDLKIEFDFENGWEQTEMVGSGADDLGEFYVVERLQEFVREVEQILDQVMVCIYYYLGIVREVTEQIVGEMHVVKEVIEQVVGEMKVFYVVEYLVDQIAKKEIEQIVDEVLIVVKSVIEQIVEELGVFDVVEQVEMLGVVKEVIEQIVGEMEEYGAVEHKMMVVYDESDIEEE